MKLSLKQLNELAAHEASEVLFSICASKNWVVSMLAKRPFEDVSSVLDAAGKAWDACTHEDYLEAFSGHPEIGDLSALRSKYAKVANSEQGQILEASEATIKMLAQLNRQYFLKNGFIFIVCATGKSAEEMLSLLQERIHLDRKTEMCNAANEQLAIMRIRLEKLMSGSQ